MPFFLVLLLVAFGTYLITGSRNVSAVDTAITWEDVFTFLKQKQLMTSDLVSTPDTNLSAYTVTASAASTPSVGQPSTFNVNLISQVSQSNLIVNLEVYDSKNTQLHQQFFENQSLSAGTPISFSLNWTPPSEGDYRLKVGLFSSDWVHNYHWEDNALSFKVGQNSNSPLPLLTPTLVPTQSPSVNSPAPASAGTGYTVGNDGKIYKNGQKITLSGVSWFGLEGDTKAPHGLWTRNWQEMIAQIKSTGFNAVRLPYCPGTLTNSPVSGIDYSQNADLQGLKSLDIMDKVMAELNRQQLYIMPDVHTVNCQYITDLWKTDSYSEAKWIEDLAFVANRYKHLEYFVGLDIKNEPKGIATWGTGNADTDWNIAAQKAGQKILSANPNILVVVEGIEKNPTCSDNSIAHWWGGNMEPVACTPIDTNFIPANKLVYSPHVYGPDVHPQSYFNAANFPANMPAIWDKHFGFLKSKGHAMIIGEYGGKFGQGDPKDVTWQNAIVDYLSQKGICDNFYWSWNPNSSDTGGILSDDWKTVNKGKADLLARYRSSCR